MGAQCNKVGAVATGEVFFLDIGLLMGAMFLILARVNITFGIINSLQPSKS